MQQNSLRSPETISEPDLPNWVPPAARDYLEHTENGRPMRALARDDGRHASTILRQVRKLETRRDDPLVDEALTALGQQLPQSRATRSETALKIRTVRASKKIANDHEIDGEARRILRRMCETSAFLIVASSLEKAVVMRQTSTHKPVRTAIVERRVAQAFALKDWIECTKKGKVARYQITFAGRAALKRLIAQEIRQRSCQPGLTSVISPFQEQHKEWESRKVGSGDGAKRLRYNLAESPLTSLGRRKGKNGSPFLTPDLVQAGERLREDFETAQMGPRITQNWDRFLTSGGSGFQNSSVAEGPRAARERVSGALKFLGPGLGDIALRCCCYLEGMETAEKRMGWSARSGKIVLRIALQRLKLHYESVHGTLSPMIG